MNFDVVLVSTGLHVTRLMTTNRAAALACLQPGQALAATLAPSLPAVLRNGAWLSVPQQPSPWHALDPQSLTWREDNPSAERIELQRAIVRKRRDSMLARCDWTQGDDAPEEVKALWKPYRQELRDVTEQAGFPFNVTWPEEPEVA